MISLITISETAIITLKARSLEDRILQSGTHGITDQSLLNGLTRRLPADTTERILNSKLPAALTRYIALRARKYDEVAKQFLKDEPNGLVVSLGCGFDTRYWRVSRQPWRYVEVDLPEIVFIKRQVLGDQIDYPIIASSVSETSWIKAVSRIQTEKVLFIAEGLLMYLPQDAVKTLFKRLTQTFSNASFVFEVVNKRYTQGFWKTIAARKMKRRLHSDAGTAYQFGISKADEIETYGEGIKVVEEWSYFEEREIKPKFLTCLRHLKFLSRTQWTIKAAIR